MKFIQTIKDDIRIVRSRDPAAKGLFEIIFLYPGLKAIRMHRRANWFYRHKMPFIARWISQRCSRKTGIEIHPAAKIGKDFFIDHGTGVVIGETTEIGDNVILYQGVTLGGTGKETGKRHPTLGNNILVGAGAKILGSVTIGDNTKIAAGAVVLNDIPPNSTAVGVPAKVVRVDGERPEDLDQIHVPDPIQQEINRLEAEITALKEAVEKEKNQ
ncbi:MAG: serine O-acetyltransferase [Clostridia bacterium]|nr:serine O-acetyltransferase [Clostridia bacterium]MBR5772692.1 serine O-acetyltransferase [Clostridia bacterium]